MKKKIFLLIPGILFIFCIGFIYVSPDAVAQIGKNNKAKIEIPETLQQVFDNSCKACHSDDGKKVAKALLNFSKWDHYSRAAQLRKGKAICKMIEKGKMPPEQFNESNPELALTDAQKESVCKWVKSMSLQK